MKHVFLIALLFSLAACTSDSLPPTDEPQEVPAVEVPDAYRDKIRTQPYPKADNELMINPAPLIVPQSQKTGEMLEFALSSSASFNTSETLVSTLQTGCFFNPHRVLKAGTWYWRFRSCAADGTVASEWSEAIAFEVTGDEAVFVTPSFADFVCNAPRDYPRLYCFLAPRIDEARRKVASHSEYKALLTRAATALDTNYQALGDLCSQASVLKAQAFGSIRQPTSRSSRAMRTSCTKCWRHFAWLLHPTGSCLPTISRRPMWRHLVFWPTTCFTTAWSRQNVRQPKSC